MINAKMSELIDDWTRYRQGTLDVDKSHFLGLFKSEMTDVELQSALEFFPAAGELKDRLNRVLSAGVLERHLYLQRPPVTDCQSLLLRGRGFRSKSTSVRRLDNSSYRPSRVRRRLSFQVTVRLNENGRRITRTVGCSITSPIACSCPSLAHRALTTRFERRCMALLRTTTWLVTSRSQCSGWI